MLKSTVPTFTPLKHHPDWIPYLRLDLAKAEAKATGFFFDGAASVPRDSSEPRVVHFELPSSSREDLSLYLELWGDDLIRRIRAGAWLRYGNGEEWLLLDDDANEAERQLRCELLELPVRYHQVPVELYFAHYPIGHRGPRGLDLCRLAEQIASVALEHEIDEHLVLLDANEVWEYLERKVALESRR